ncbi:MAG: hypothetical protein ACOC44_19155 [Promethearchaeia archaeon]
MKLNNQFLMNLINKDDPLDAIFHYIQDLMKVDEGIEYIGHQKRINNYYDQEKRIKDLEDALIKIFPEIYDTYLVNKCLSEKTLDESQPVIFMDSLSLREAFLLAQDLELVKGYSVKMGYDFSYLPSDTKHFFENFNTDALQDEEMTEIIDAQKISINGNEKFMKSRFPDAYIENIKEGETQIQTLPEIYEKIFSLIVELLETIEAEKVQVISDHGYVRLEGNFQSPVPPNDQKTIKKLIKGARFKPASEVNADRFVKKGYLVKSNDNYLVKGRYVWPIRGKYKVFQHGGLSLLECMTPLLEIEF